MSESATRTRPEVLTREQWTQRARAHEDRVSPYTQPFLDRRFRGEKHPVEDFLFTYYTLSPAQFIRWHPGPGVVLLDASERADWKFYRPATRAELAATGAREGASGVVVDATAFLAKRGTAVRFTRDLQRVVVDIRVDKDIASFIDDDAEFWIVRPQVSAQGISRLDTVLTGAFIEGYWDDKPGAADLDVHEGLDKAPLSVSAEQVAEVAVDAVRTGKETVWAPEPMRWVMSALRHVPAPVFRKLPI